MHNPLAYEYFPNLCSFPTHSSQAAEKLVVHFSELDLPALTVKITAFCLQMKANETCHHKSFDLNDSIRQEIQVKKLMRMPDESPL